MGGVGGRGRASTHGAFSWVGGCKSSVLNPTKNDFEFFWGREKSGATEARDGLDFGFGRSRGVAAGQARMERFRGLAVANRRF